MNQQERDQLRALAENAQGGPWEASDIEVGADYDEGYETVAIMLAPHPTKVIQRRANAAFIAACRDAVPRLLDELDAAEKRLSAKDAAIQALGDEVGRLTAGSRVQPEPFSTASNVDPMEDPYTAASRRCTQSDEPYSARGVTE